MGTNRLESFSDGVIAVAITLLVLGISVPAPGSGRLGHELASRWPEYAAYVVSFVTIGIIWINHHVMINRLATADHMILMLNLLLLMSIGVLPFATELMAAYLRQSSGQTLAAVVYGGAFLVMSLLFATLNRHILMVKAHMLAEPLSLAQRRVILGRSVVGLIPYALATALAVVSPYVTLIICAALALYYARPIASGVMS
jgi:TMEM175 potassium channel family protein